VPPAGLGRQEGTSRGDKLQRCRRAGKIEAGRDKAPGAVPQEFQHGARILFARDDNARRRQRHVNKFIKCVENLWKSRFAYAEKYQVDLIV
jgi:hypothetical protein